MFDAVLEHIYLSCIAFGFVGAALHLSNTEEKVSARYAMAYLVTGMTMANLLAPHLFKILTVLPLEVIATGVGATGKHWFAILELAFSKLDLLGKTKNE